MGPGTCHSSEIRGCIRENRKKNSFYHLPFGVFLSDRPDLSTGLVAFEMAGFVDQVDEAKTALEASQHVAKVISVAPEAW